MQVAEQSTLYILLIAVAGILVIPLQLTANLVFSVLLSKRLRSDAQEMLRGSLSDSL